jgi:hypothetical protein
MNTAGPTSRGWSTTSRSGWRARTAAVLLAHDDVHDPRAEVVGGGPGRARLADAAQQVQRRVGAVEDDHWRRRDRDRAGEPGAVREVKGPVGRGAAHADRLERLRAEAAVIAGITFGESSLSGGQRLSQPRDIRVDAPRHARSWVSTDASLTDLGAAST